MARLPVVILGTLPYGESEEECKLIMQYWKNISSKKESRDHWTTERTSHKNTNAFIITSSALHNIRDWLTDWLCTLHTYLTTRLNLGSLIISNYLYKYIFELIFLLYSRNSYCSEKVLWQMLEVKFVFSLCWEHLYPYCKSVAN